MIKAFFGMQNSLKAAGVMRLGNYAFQAILMLALTPFIVGHVGKSGFGIWTAVSALTGYYGLVNLGLGSAMVRHLSRHAARDEKLEMNHVLGTGFAFFIFTGTLVGVGGYLASDWLAGLFSSAENDQKNFSSLLALVSIALAVDFIGVTFSSILNAHEKYLTQTLMESGRMVLRAVLIVSLLLCGHGLAGLGITVLVVSSVMLMTNVFLVVRGDFNLDISLLNARGKTLKELLKYGSSTALMNVVSLTRTKVGHVILASAVSFSSVASFGVASNLVMQYQGLIFSFNSALTARFSRLDAASNGSEICKLFRKTLFSNAFLTFGGALMILLFGKSFIFWWLGNDFSDVVLPLHVLTIGYATALAQNSGWNVMFGLNKHHKMAYVSIVEAAALVVLALCLVGKYGMLGIAVATAVTMVITKSVVQPIYIIRILKMSIQSYINPILAPLAAAILVGVAGAFSLKVFPAITSNIGFTVFAASVVALAYSLSVYFLCRKATFFVAPKVLNRVLQS